MAVYETNCPFRNRLLPYGATKRWEQSHPCASQRFSHVREDTLASRSQGVDFAKVPAGSFIFGNLTDPFVVFKMGYIASGSIKGGGTKQSRVVGSSSDE